MGESDTCLAGETDLLEDKGDLLLLLRDGEGDLRYVGDLPLDGEGDRLHSAGECDLLREAVLRYGEDLLCGDDLCLDDFCLGEDGYLPCGDGDKPLLGGD